MSKATRDAYGEALKDLGAKMADLIVLDADLSKSTKTNIFAKAFPERFFNVGIAEQNMMGVAAGLAASGKIPFVSTFAIFATGRAYEQIRNSICYPKLNVKIAATHAGITVGEDGATHQSIEDISLMRSIPNMTVIVPSDAAETYAAVHFAANYEGPVYLRLGRMTVPDVYSSGYIFQHGKAVQVEDGEDVTVVATGIMVSMAKQAAKVLKTEGYSVRVLNVHTIKPIDHVSIVEAAGQTGAIVTCEEHSIIGGVGSAVAELLAESNPVPIVRLGIPDMFGESGTPADLLDMHGLTVEGIIRAVKKAVQMKMRHSRNR